MTGQADGELIFKAAGQIISGWKAVNVSRSVQTVPSTFTLTCSARFPGEMRTVVPLNSPATLTIGGHVVLVGYLEKMQVKLSSSQHDVILIGRGRVCDLVDTSAIISNMTRTGASVSALATEIVAPYAGPIQVLTPDGEGNSRNYTFNVSLGESPFEIISRTARYEGLLTYEDANGNLVLARVGTAKHSSGFTEGQNIQESTYSVGFDERFSVYIPLLMSTDTLTRNGAPLSGNAAGAPVNDVGVNRYRPRIIVSEQMVADSFLAEQRAMWEATRRVGESFSVTVVADSWLDSAGMPWTPNMIAPVSIPSIGLVQPDWVIMDVQFRRDGSSGTTAIIRLMPPEALTVEPNALNEMDARMISPRNSPANSPVGEPSTNPPSITAPNGLGPS